MAEKRAAYEYYVPPELRPFTRNVKPLVKGLNTGIAELAGFPVYLANLTPTLINLLPGKQGMKPFSEKPLGGAQTFKDLMAAGNIDTYKDLQSISKNEYGAGVTGMLLGEALLSMFPVKRAVDALMAGKKGKKDALPTLTAGGVDLSKRDLFKKAGAAAVSAAMAPSILREAGDIISTPGVARVGKTAVSSSAVVARSRALASELSDFMIESLFKKTKKAQKLSTKELDAKTAEYNKVLEDFLKGKDYDALIKLSKNDLADLYNQKNFSAHKGAGDPLRSKEYGPLLDRVFKDKGIGLDSQGNYKKLLRNEGDPPQPNLLKGDNDLMTTFEKRDKRKLPSENLINLAPTKKNIIPEMFPSGTTAKTTSLFPNEAKKGRQLLIVSCGDKKCPDVGNMKALDRYLGPIFTSIRKAGVPENVDIAILSAKHGLIRADAPIENYNQLMTKDKVKDFLSNPNEMSKIAETMQGYDNVLVQGGDNYKNVIKSAAGDIPFTEVPKGRGIGDQRSFVAQFLKDQDKESIPDLGNFKAIKKDDLLGGYNPVTGKKDKPQRFFHGTNQSFKEFDPKSKYTFVADHPETAEYYSGITVDKFDSGANIRPVYLKKANYFDVDNPKHIKMLRESKFYKSDKKNLDLFGEYDSLSGDPKNQDNFIDSVEAGNYDTIENSGLIKWIKSQGFDGFTTYEQSGKNYAVFDTKNIVSGVEKKAKGGIAGLSDIARDMFKGPKGIGTYESFMVS